MENKLHLPLHFDFLCEKIFDPQRIAIHFYTLDLINVTGVKSFSDVTTAQHVLESRMVGIKVKELESIILFFQKKIKPILI